MLRNSTKDITKPESAPDLTITSQPTPPISIENCAVNIQPPAQKDFDTALMAIFTRHHALKLDDDIARMTGYLFGDTRQALLHIKSETLSDCKAKLDAFIQSQPTDDREDPRLAAYRSATCDALARNMLEQEQAIDRTIAAEMRALASDDTHTAVIHTMNDYMQYKHLILKIYLGLAATFYQAAAEYYLERWKLSHEDPVKLKKECDSFNYIFKGIIQINSDYTLTSIKSISETLFRKKPAQAEELVNEMLKRAASNKLDDTKSSYAILIKHLNAFTHHPHYSEGQYFKPLDSKEKKHAIYFHEDIFVTFNHYINAKAAYDCIAPEPIDAASNLHVQLRSRVIEFNKCVAETTEKELAAAKENIERYQVFLNDVIAINETSQSLETKLHATSQKFKELKLPLQKIRQIGLPGTITKALIDTFEKGALGKKQRELLSTFTDFRSRIAEKQKKLHQLKLDFEDAKLTMHVVDASEHTQAIQYELKQIKHGISQLANDIADTKVALLAASKFLDQVQTAKSTIDSAMQYHQDLIDGNIHDDYFTEESGAHQPFAAALKKISNLKDRKHDEMLPDELKKYFDESAALLTQTQKDLTAILRCHLLFNHILDFNFWRLKIDRNITIQANHQRYRLPRAIFSLIELAKHPAYQHWTNDPEAARDLLEAMRNLAAKTQCKSPAINQLMAMIAQQDGALIPPANKRHPLRLIQQDEILNVQKKPPFWKRHPILKKILIGTAIGLLAFAAVAVITGLILSGLGILAGLVALVGGASAAWGIAGGSFAAAGGIGAGIGAMTSKVQQHREQHQPRQHPIARMEPPPPAYKPEASRSVLQEVRLSSAKGAMFQQPNKLFSQQTAFDELVADHIIEAYSGKVDDATSSPKLRVSLNKLWDDSHHSLDIFLPAIEHSRPVTADCIIKKAIHHAADQYPHVISTYPAASAVRNRYAPQAMVENNNNNHPSRRLAMN